jgi:hypothetical protein
MSLTPDPFTTACPLQCPLPLAFSSDLEFGYRDPGNFTIDTNQGPYTSFLFGRPTSPPSYTYGDDFWNKEDIGHQIFDFAGPSLSSQPTIDELVNTTQVTSYNYTHSSSFNTYPTCPPATPFPTTSTASYSRTPPTLSKPTTTPP